MLLLAQQGGAKLFYFSNGNIEVATGCHWVNILMDCAGKWNAFSAQMSNRLIECPFFIGDNKVLEARYGRYEWVRSDIAPHIPTKLPSSALFARCFISAKWPFASFHRR